MTGTHISPSEVERYLNNKEKPIILHAMDGEIWGASVAALELFGYSNEEMRQMYLANIKPKTLRLSDVCKPRKAEGSLTIFQRRNNRRFAAKVDTKILRTTFLRESIDLVCLELTIVSASSNPANDQPQIDFQESAEFVEELVKDSYSPLLKIRKVIQDIEKTPLNSSQKACLRKLKACCDDIWFQNDNIGDTFKLSLNTLSLERQPFNIIDLIGDLQTQAQIKNRNFSLHLDSNIPELVYGDEKRLMKLWVTTLKKIEFFYQISNISIKARYKVHRDRGETLCLDICIEVDSELNKEDSFGNHFGLLIGSPAIHACKNIAKLMNGSIQFGKDEETKIRMSLEVELPEVHDLGLIGDKKFLNNREIILVETVPGLLNQQLHSWGARVERFQSIDLAVSYLSDENVKNHLVIFNGANSQEIENFLKDLPDIENLIILGECENLDVSQRYIRVPSPYKPALLGNILSQMGHQKFPYPYSNFNRARGRKDSETKANILVVDDDDGMREALHSTLEKQQYCVDIAVNGIDAVLACAHSQYDIILMDINLPYMDGIETVIHLRKVSDLNTKTPIVVISADTSVNARLSVEQVGATAQLTKPVDAKLLLDTIDQLVCAAQEEREIPALEGSKSLRRRAAESLQQEAKQEVLIDEQVLDRLIEDTSLPTCKEMVDMFIEESLVSLGEISKCCVTGDWKTVLDHAHSIRSACRTFGCEALYNMTTQLEEESRNNNLGESIRIASLLPSLFLQSQQNLYNYCSLQLRGTKK